MHVRVCVDMSVLACICPPSPVLQAHGTIVGFPGAEVSTTQDLVHSAAHTYVERNGTCVVCTKAACSAVECGGDVCCVVCMRFSNCLFH